MSKSVTDFLLEMGFPFAGSVLLITRERSIKIIFTRPSRTLKCNHSFPETGTEKKAKAVPSVNKSGSTLLRLGGQIAQPCSLFAV